MTDEEIKRLAHELAPILSEKMQRDVMNSIYKDAGKNVFGLLKSLFWGSVLFLAAWGIVPHTTGK